MSENFDDFAYKSNPFEDPSVVAASLYAEKPSPKVELMMESHNSRVQTEIKSASINPDNIGRELDELRRREEEISRREMELKRREEKVSAVPSGYVRAPNFPPFPSWFCMKPCLYVNVMEEIPAQHRPLCNQVLYQWWAYLIVSLFNVLCMIAYLASGGDQGTLSLILSIIFCVTLVPLSFLFVFRPLYLAFKSNSSFGFIVFFLSFGIEIIVLIVQCLGAKGSGWAGFIGAASMFDSKNVFAGVIMIVCAFTYFSMLVFHIIIIRKVSIIYRGSGASLQQAQSEFASGAWKHGSTAFFASQAGPPAANFP